jgi:hypothetical protein
MVTHIVFPSKASADSLLFEIAVTPMPEGFSTPVWVWRNSDNPTEPQDYVVGADGRVVIAHPFDDIQLKWLKAYLAGQAGVEILDDLPKDWKYPEIK